MSAVPLSNRSRELSDVRRRVTSLLDKGVTVQRIVIESGVPRGEVEGWLNNSPRAELVEPRLAAWLEELEKPLQEQREPEWVETPTSSQIMGALEFARCTPTIAIIYGGAGVSKTTTALRYADRHSFGRGDGRVYYVAAGRWNRSPTAILQRIAEAADSYVGAYRNDVLARNILARIAPGDLIVIDEAQHLDADALDGVRYFHDEGRIGICYLGNELVYTRISRGGRRAAFAQLYSRVGMRLHLVHPSEGDADALLEAWGIRGRGERAYAQDVARQPGGLRTLTQVLRQASLAAKDMGRPVDRELMQAAAESLGLED